MKLSLVATLYQSATFVAEFHRQASEAARLHAGEDYEIVLVNDGSPDASLDIAARLSDVDPHIVLIDLSRNFGHHKAMMTGMAHATGDYVFLLDSDLEEDPAWLASFSEQMQRDGSDVVFGIRTLRDDPWGSRWAAGLFYKLFRFFARMDIPDNIVTARLMTRRYVNALLLHDEREVFLLGLWQITGFKQTPQKVAKLHKGRSTYTFRRKISLFVNSVTSFSSAPLIGILVCGMIISLLALLFALYLAVNWFYFDRPAAGWTSVVASVWLLGGINTAFIGIVGIYVSKIFSETKRRPYTIVRHIYGRAGEPARKKTGTPAQ